MGELGSRERFMFRMRMRFVVKNQPSGECKHYPDGLVVFQMFYCIVRRIVRRPKSGQAPVSLYMTRPSRYWSILPSFRRRRIAKHSCVSVKPQILSSSLNVYLLPVRIRLESVLLLVMIESMSVLCPMCRLTTYQHCGPASGSPLFSKFYSYR